VFTGWFSGRRVPLRGPGFHAAHRAAARPGPSGFNPSRLRAVPALRTPFAGADLTA